MKNRLSILCMMISAICGILYADESASILIRTDRIWEYWESSLVMYGSRQVQKLTRFRFGEEEEIGGRRYTRLNRIFSKIQIYHLDYEPGEIEVDSTVVCTAHLREEAGKVYMLAEGNDIYLYKGNEKPNEDSWAKHPMTFSDGEELLLYDFSSPEGSVQEMLTSVQPMGNVPTVYKVVTPTLMVSKKEEDCGELGVLKKVRVQNGLYTAMARYEPLSSGEGDGYDFNIPDNAPIVEKDGVYTEYLEGIGNIGKGTLTEVSTLGDVAAAINGGYFIRTLNNVYDLEGNILYRGADRTISVIVSVDTIPEDPENDTAMYDLMGRRIAKPLPGTVYIRGGRKFVAR